MEKSNISTNISTDTDRLLCVRSEIPSGWDRVTVLVNYPKTKSKSRYTHIEHKDLSNAGLVQVGLVHAGL